MSDTIGDGKGPGLAKIKPEHHQRTLDRWNKRALEDFRNSPFSAVLCHMVENRIPFVGGGDYGLALQPVPLAQIAEYLKGSSNQKPFGVAMVVFQAINHRLVSPDQIFSICRLLEEKRFASLPEILKQIAASRADLGISTVSGYCAKKLERALSPIRIFKPGLKRKKFFPSRKRSENSDSDGKS